MGEIATVPAKVDADRQLISEVAMDIGKELAAKIEVMYPDVWTVMNSGCRLTIRNCVHNEIMAALDTINADEIRARLEHRKEWRRRWKKIYRDLRRKADNPATPSKLEG